MTSLETLLLMIPKQGKLARLRDPLGLTRQRYKSLKEKPWLIDVQGLVELYSSVNMSKEDAKSFATWRQLRVVFLRSDGLPETGKGVKEASIACRELQFVIKEAKSPKTAENGENVNGTNEIRCPFSVSSFDELVNSSRSRLLEIPCSLIEDSSVSLSGIPNGKNRSFQIELEGAGLKDEQRRPIILHYFQIGLYDE